jgi:hypothetical protein
VADFAVTAGLVFVPGQMMDVLHIPLPRAGLDQRGGGTADFLTRNLWGSKITALAMYRFRPLEWTAEQVTKAGLGIARPITDLILRGGEPKAEMPAPAAAV